MEAQWREALKNIEIVPNQQEQKTAWIRAIQRNREVWVFVSGKTTRSHLDWPQGRGLEVIGLRGEAPKITFYLGL